MGFNGAACCGYPLTHALKLRPLLEFLFLTQLSPYNVSNNRHWEIIRFLNAIQSCYFNVNFRKDPFTTWAPS